MARFLPTSHLAAAALLLGILPLSSPTASELLTSLNQKAQAARKSGDKQAYLSAALQVQTLLNDSPASVKAVAKAYLRSGDTQAALTALSHLAELGQIDDALLQGKDPEFAALQNLAAYQSILKQFTANNSPISASETAFVLPDAGLLPEDITYDPQSKSFLITSVLEKKIIRITEQGKATDFAQSPSHWPIFAIKADPAHNLVWATEAAIDGFSAAPKSDWGRSAVLCFNLQTGALLRRIEGPAHTTLGDMALTKDGNPIVTDGDGGGVYKVTGNHLELLNGKDFISPQTPAMLPDGTHAFVPDYLRGIAILDLNTGDLKTGHVLWINHDSGKKSSAKQAALSGVDGLYFDHGALILIQNGTAPERVIRLQLNQTMTQVVSEQIIERSTPTLGDPTHGVFVGDSFYYIANSGWNNLDEHGDVKAGGKLTPARIMRFHLK